MKPTLNTKTLLTAFLLLLLMIALGPVQAQTKKLIFSNNNEQIDIQGNASINITSGNITVETVGAKRVVNDAPASLDFYPSDSYTLTTFPGSVEVNWSAYFAAACTASVPSGNSPSWTTSPSKAIGVGNKQTVTVTTADTLLKLTCTSINGGPSAAKEILISQATGGTSGTGGDPVIASFNLQGYSGATPTIPSDGSYTVAWNVTGLDGVNGSCTANNSDQINHGGWRGNISPANGTKLISITGSPTLSLTCTNGGNPVVKSIVINNSGLSNPPAGCESVVPPVGLTMVSHLYSNPRGVMDNPATSGEGMGHAFLEDTGGGKTFAVKVDEVLPKTFTSIGGIVVPSNHGTYINGHLQRTFNFTNSTSSSGEFKRIIYSMSTCPGDFDTTKTAACQSNIPGGSSKILMTSNPTDPFLGFDNTCLLEKGKTYYLNFFSGEATGPSDNSAIYDVNKRKCNGPNPYNNRCGVLMNEDG